MPRVQAPLKKANARSWASNTISWLSRGYARTNSIRLWQSRTCATFTVTVTPAISTISWLQSNWYASPGAKLSGTKAAAVAAVRSRCHAAAYRRTASWPPS